MQLLPIATNRIVVTFITIVLSCSASGGQHLVDVQAFQAMPPTGRFCFVRDFPFWKTDSAATASILSQLLPTAERVRDHRTVFALKFQQFQQRNSLKLNQKDILQLLVEMENMANGHDWEVEKVVAHHYLVFEKYNLKDIPIERMYAEVLNTFGRMEELGFERFEDYQLDGILFELGQFMYTLEDLKKMFSYLSVAERFIHFTESRQYHAILILNYLETYFQREKNYPKAIEYAQKILKFSRELATTHPETEWRRRFWEGLALLDIANMLVEQGNLASGERYADLGYKMSKAGYAGHPYATLRGEYDAAQVLLDIKLKTGKLEEAAALIRREQEIQKKLSSDPKIDVHYFESLKFYYNCARYYELLGDATRALHYTHLAQTLKDSLDRRNDAHKYEQIQRRLEAEKYIRQLQLVENEKQLQKWLLYAACVILVLVLALAFGWFKRLQYMRRQKEAELNAAINDLAVLTQDFRDKSEMVENLRREMKALATQNQRSEYLEQLTHSVILTDDDWTHFKELFEKVHPGYIAEQKAQCPDLTRAELRLLALEKLGLDVHEIANILGVSTNTVYQTRRRMRKKEGALPSTSI
jgi:tetratricopeptide (TPR) repeat protein